MNPRTVLVINSGSSSIKYQLVDPLAGLALASGLVEKIGESAGNIEHTYGEKTVTVDQPIPDHGAGLSKVLELFSEVGPDLSAAGIIAVGHRTVQGGPKIAAPVKIDDHVVTLIEEFSALAPLHNPPALKGITVARKLMPEIPHIAVFDTAFFQDLPREAATYALDKTVAQKYSIRRYGAHGTSHQYVSQKVSEILGQSDLKQIVLHLGNGASASAVRADRAVETSMGLTPLEGLVMGTRTGDIDPATVFHLSRVADMSVDQIDQLFNKASGLKGLAGDNDMRGVRKMAEGGDASAQLALEVYVHRLLKYVGSYTAVLGGLDALTFTAGVGENDSQIRADLCARLAFMGIALDPKANSVRSGEPRIISTPESKVTVLVVPTNEELAIAKQCLELV